MPPFAAFEGTSRINRPWRNGHTPWIRQLGKGFGDSAYARISGRALNRGKTTRAGRYAELNAIAEAQLRAELEFWPELELLSG